jgi:hypothetical protein
MSSKSDFQKRDSTGSAAASYKEMIEGHRNVLHEVAKSALSLPGIPADERKVLEIEIHNLSGIDQLVALIDKNLNGVNRTAALSSLQRAISAALLIGSRAVKNPVSGKLQTKGAASILASRSKHLDSLVEKHVKIILQKHHSLTANAIMNRILVPVNEELVKIPKPLTAAEKKMDPLPEPKEKAAKPDAIRGRVTKILAKIRKEAA